MHTRTLVLGTSLLASALASGGAGQVASPSGQRPTTVADDRLAKLPPALREQGRRILAEPDEDKRADLVEDLAETDAVGALDFLLALLDTEPSADVREDIVDELEDVSDPRVGPALEKRVLTDPDVEIALASLDLLRARAETPLLRLLERRLDDEQQTGNAATVGRLLREQERWTTVVRGGLLPTFLQTPPPVFAVAPPQQPVRVLAFGDFGDGSEAQRLVAAAMLRYHREHPFDFAVMLLLLVTYGLRAREVAALTLDDVDWRHDRLRVHRAQSRALDRLSALPVGWSGDARVPPERPAGDRLASRLLSDAGTMRTDYAFGRVLSSGSLLRQAGIVVPRPGSHTPRHTCVQRLVDAWWPLTSIGDYVGHRSPASTEIYSKAAIETLREVACGPQGGDRMKSSWIGFQSSLASGITAFLAHKRALGCLFRVEELSLRLLDRFLTKRQITSLAAITPDVVDAFLASRPRHAPRSYNHLRGTLIRLFEWLAAHDRFGPSPVRARPRRPTRRRLPFLFDDDTTRRLLTISSQLPDRGGTVSRGPTYRVIFRFLYGLGLRVGEVARLAVGDVDLIRDLLVIRETKFYKSRLVPFGPRVDTALRDHLARRTRRVGALAPSAPLFSLRRDRPVSAGTICQTFHHLVPRLELSMPDGTAFTGP